jgi:site-specific recombinase XerD
MVTATTPLATQTVDERWTQIEEFLDFKNLRLSSRRSYETWLRNFSAWTVKHWQDITHDDIRQYCDHLAQQQKKDRWTTRLTPRYSLNSQYAALIALKSFFGWLQQNSYIVQNPTYNR